MRVSWNKIIFDIKLKIYHFVLHVFDNFVNEEKTSWNIIHFFFKINGQQNPSDNNIVYEQLNDYQKHYHEN